MNTTMTIRYVNVDRTVVTALCRGRLYCDVVAPGYVRLGAQYDMVRAICRSPDRPNPNFFTFT